MNRCLTATATMALVLLLSASTAGAATPGSFTCSGGSSGNMATIPAGTYSQVTVTGICHILGAITGPAVGPGGSEIITNCNAAGGPVNVIGSLTVVAGAFLDAASCAPSVTVGGNVVVGSEGTLILGCSPFLVIMPPFPPFPSLCPGITTSDSVGGNVTADHPRALIFHSNTIGGNVSISGGGGGDNCNGDPTLAAALDSSLGLFGPTPAYTDFENNTIGGGVSISGMKGCWFGIFRNQIHKNVILNNNTFNDTDAMEVAENTIGRNLICFGDTPAPQFGDASPFPPQFPTLQNTVTGQKLGQCTKV